MDASKILFCFLLIPLPSLTASNGCSVSYCPQNFNVIRFPFRLTEQQPERCGFPGFNLSCAGPTTMLIHLPNSGEFAVRTIVYLSQIIQIYDPSKCLPARLLNFDLSGSPFSAPYFQNYTLLSCPNDVTLSGFTIINCLSNSSFTTIATASTSLVESMIGNQTACRVTGFLRIPLTKQPDQEGFSSSLEDDIVLTWDSPDCKRCETVRGMCGYANSTTQETTCFSDDEDDLQQNSQIFRIIALAMAIPAMTASLAIACFMCTKDRNNELTRNRRVTASNTATRMPDAAIVPQGTIGPDQVAIESYTKVVLGESKRLPGHDDTTCPICLSEYHAKETVRCIPGCQHCFHADCIDEWLKMKGTCPVCRNSPSPVHVES